MWSNEIHDIYYSQNSLLSGSDDRSPTLQKIAQIYYLQKTSPWAINTTQSKHNVILPTLYNNFVKSLVVYFTLMFRIIWNFQRANICKLFHVCLSFLRRKQLPFEIKLKSTIFSSFLHHFSCVVMHASFVPILASMLDWIQIVYRWGRQNRPSHVGNNMGKCQNLQNIQTVQIWLSFHINGMLWCGHTVFQKEYITCIMSGSVYLFFHKQEKELILETGCVCVSPWKLIQY